MNTGIEIVNEGESICARIKGEIDHHRASLIREELDTLIAESRPDLLILDFGGVSFMDSSGIGLILGRYRAVSAYGGRILVKNAKSNIKKILELAGISKLISQA